MRRRRLAFSLLFLLGMAAASCGGDGGGGPDDGAPDGGADATGGDVRPDGAGPLDGGGGADALDTARRDGADTDDDGADAAPDVARDTAADVPPDGAPDGGGDIVPDIVPDVAPDGGGDVAPDGGGDIAPDVVPDAPDVTEVETTLCRPCRTDADCAAAGEEAWCLPQGAQGSFCAPACDDDCPAGYECIDVLLDDVLVRACAPEGGGECPCGPDQQGFTTACRIENEYGACEGERTCDVACDAATPAPEDCNGLDDDCDGLTDAYAIDCSTVCGPGTDTCTDGAWSGCTAEQPIRCLDWDTCVEDDYCGETCPTAPDEVCNGVDDDCDGATDGMTRDCETDCGTGAETCTDGAWVDCDAPPVALCYEFDTCTPFQTCDPAECDETPPEECNGVDDDCDGVTDRFDRPCSTNCGEGTETCIAGLWTICDAPSLRTCVDYETCLNQEMCVVSCPLPPAEECNGLDDDCDGTTDAMIRTCTSACGSGTERCTAGEWSDCNAPPSYTCLDYETCEEFEQCTPACPTAPFEECNGIDDDCDGTTDGMTRPCATDCGQGVETCTEGAWVGCTARQPLLCTAWLSCEPQGMCLDECPAPPPEICNGRDDDCDGVTDQLDRDCSTMCGVGEEHCEDGAWEGCGAPQPITCHDFERCRLEELCADECPPPPSEECNQLDDDCDGVTDNFSVPCDLPCGSGVQTCVDGVWDDCDAPAYQECIDFATCETVIVCGEDIECPFVPVDVCNGIDDDCNGVTDDGAPEELCGEPPAASCAGDIREGWADVGNCLSGACVYAPRDTYCPWGCEGGECLPCDGGCTGLSCGDDGCGEDCGTCTEGTPLSPGRNARLNILARWYTPATTDHRVVIAPSEDPGGTFHGQMYYVAATDNLGGFPIHQLLGGSDWMLSNTTSEPGYTLQRIVGYSGLFPNDDLCPIVRWYSAARGDRAAGFCGEDLAGSGYVQEDVTGSGLERYGTACSVPVEIEGDQVRLVANRVAGGAVAELWWNGRQFLNHHDFGRYLQTWFTNGTARADRPTEAGDRYGCPGAVTGAWAHGSPVIDLETGDGTLHTMTHPLQWEPDNLGGGPDSPVAYLGTISKDVELDFAGSAHTIAWEVAVNASTGSQDLVLQILRAALTADFERQYVYDAVAQSTVEVSGRVPAGGCLDAAADPRLFVNAGAAIAATADGSFALGIYRRAGRGEVEFCRGASAEGGATGAGFRSVAVVQRLPHGLAGGTWTHPVFVLVGTLDDVRAAARALLEAGH